MGSGFSKSFLLVDWPRTAVSDSQESICHFQVCLVQSVYTYLSWPGLAAWGISFSLFPVFFFPCPSLTVLQLLKISMSVCLSVCHSQSTPPWGFSDRRFHFPADVASSIQSEEPAPDWPGPWPRQASWQSKHLVAISGADIKNIFSSIQCWIFLLGSLGHAISCPNTQ